MLITSIFKFLKILVNDYILTTDSGSHHPNARFYDMENDMESGILPYLFIL